MGEIANNRFVSTLTMREEGGKIAHRTRGDEQRSFLTQHLRGEVLQPINRGILPVHIISHFSLGHSLTHFRSGFGYRVRTEVDAFHPTSLPIALTLFQILLRNPAKTASKSAGSGASNSCGVSAAGMGILKRSAWRK